MEAGAQAVMRSNPFKLLRLDPSAPRELIEEAYYWQLVDLTKDALPDDAAWARIVELKAAYELLQSPRAAEAAEAAQQSDRHIGRGNGYYRLLGVDPTAEPQLVDLAFSVMVRRNGADGNGHRQELERAHAVLMDPEQRRLYDASLRQSFALVETAAALLEGPSTTASTAAPKTGEPRVSKRSPTRRPARRDTRRRERVQRDEPASEETRPNVTPPEQHPSNGVAAHLERATGNVETPDSPPAKRKRRAPSKNGHDGASTLPPGLPMPADGETNGAAPAPSKIERKAPARIRRSNGRVPAKRAPRRAIEPAPQEEPKRRFIDDPRELLDGADLLVTHGFDRSELARHDVLPLRRSDGVLTIAAPTPEAAGVARQMAGHLSERVDIVEATPRAIRTAMVTHFRPLDGYSVAHEQADREPALSARKVVSARQLAVGAAVLFVLLAAFIVVPMPTLIAVVAIATGIYVISMAFKLLLVARALTHRWETPTPDDELGRLDEAALPAYTILLPVYHEAAILNDLVAAVDRIDYPKDKLDVKLLIEPDDRETQAAAAQIAFPSHFQVLVVPPDGPKGKPKACNYGLLYARGEFVVLYDAEDMPDPRQLKKALVAFRRGGWQVSCVQAKLNYFNPDQNLLTRWFTVEYSTWFDLYLPGINSLNGPIPLGGTSNHFRTQTLRRVGGWDPFNVTEDADLGIRFARNGLITSVIDSVTLEEANSKLGNWMRQRSRWIKGYMQTWLVHMRHPLKMWRELGAVGFLAFQAFVLGTFFAYFVNPLFWAMVILWYFTRAAAIEALFPTPVLYLSAVALFAGNFILVLSSMAGCLRRGFFEGVKYALLSPVYWLLMSIAAWKALYQLIWKTHYWEKTDHGFGTQPDGGARTIAG